MQFLLPRSALPDNKVLRREKLEEYFALDFIAFEELQGNEWKITTFIPEEAEYYVDLQLDKNLRDWIGPIPFNTLCFYKRLYKNSMLSFADSWSLYYWSLAVKWLISKNTMPPNVILLHIDDHRDLDSPLLIMNDNKYYSILSGELVDFFDPKTLERAIMNKSINIGSFMVPLLHALESVHILHLRYAYQGPCKEIGIECTYQEDDLLAKGKQRPALKLSDNLSRHIYCISSKIDDLIPRIHEDSLILLHIDCDAFNNRYNGDSHWHLKQSSINLKLDQILKKIDELLKQLSHLRKKFFMNVALSPGFFPSEYWRVASKYIFALAQRYGIVKDDEFSEYLKTLHPTEVFDVMPP